LVSRITRSSAVTKGPRSASCQLKSCQLPCNSAETRRTYTKSTEQIEVMKLEGYSGTMCNKHVHSTVMRSSRFHCLIGVINKPTTDRVVDILVICRKSPILTHPTCIWCPHRGWPRSNFVEIFGTRKRVPGLLRGVVCVILRLDVLVEHRLVTDRHGPMAPWMHSIAR